MARCSAHASILSGNEVAGNPVAVHVAVKGADDSFCVCVGERLEVDTPHSYHRACGSIPRFSGGRASMVRDRRNGKPVGALQAFEASPGTKSIYRIPGARDGAVFAAKWQLDRARIATDNLTHGILICRTDGTAPVTRSSRGTSVRRRPTIGAISYVCPDVPADWCVEGSCESCHVYLAQEALRQFAGRDLDSASVPAIKELFAVEDPWLRGFFQMLTSEFELANDQQRADLLFVTQAEQLLIRHLVGRHSHAGSKALTTLHAQQRANPLRPVILQRVEEYVAANLGRDIALSDLADIACMSVGHFLRAFRAACGTTPYHHVLEQRLRKACAMLRTTDLPIACIARECGFKTSSHLSSKFHASLGASPSHYRACARGDAGARAVRHRA
jgi:AraC family transcriptional regulator